MKWFAKIRPALVVVCLGSVLCWVWLAVLAANNPSGQALAGNLVAPK